MHSLYIKLSREVNEKVRYYILELTPTLFNEYVFEIRYGSTKNKRPTGVIIQHYKEFNKALPALEKKLKSKIKRGYQISVKRECLF